jgi:hypothetical protein
VVASGASAICEGTSSILNATGASTYTWMPGALTGSSVSVQPTVSETYTVTGVSANGCSDSTTIAITVNANPIATLSAANDTVCSIDGSVVLTGSPAGGVYSGNSVSGNIFDPSSAPIGVNTIDYVYVDANGCADTTSTTVHILESPIANGLASTYQGCNPLTITFNNQSTRSIWRSIF